MLISYKRGQTSVVLRVKIYDSSVTTGAGKTGLAYNTSGLKIATIADNEAATTVYTVAASNVEDITTLGTFATPTASKCRFKEVDATNHPGVYEIHIANARFAVTSAKSLMVSVSGATDAAECDVLIPLVDFDPYGASTSNISFAGGITVTQSTTDGHAIVVTGNGSGAGISTTGGATGSAMTLTGGGTSGTGLTVTTTSGNGITITSGGGNGAGVSITGNGSGAGLQSTGGATANGITATGGSSAGSGLALSGGTGGGVGFSTSGTAGYGGARFIGQGAGYGAQFIGGATGNGVYFTGGSSSGKGVYVTTSNGNGIEVAPGGTTKHAISLAGGATTGNGVNISTTSGHGVSITAILGHGITSTGGSTCNGLLLTGGNSGAALRAAGGTDAPGALFVGATTGHGVQMVGGTTGAALTLTGGSTSGNGLTVSTTDGHGISVAALGSGKDGAIIVGAQYDINADIQGSLSGAVTLATPVGLKKNTAVTAFTFVMIDETDHATPLPSLAVTATRSLDGAAFASCANAVSEIGNGVYKINLDTTDMNADVVTLKFAATGADPRILTIFTEE